MPNERLLEINLKERALYWGPSQESQVYPLSPTHTIFVHPLSEQNLDSGSIYLGLFDEKGKVLPGKYYYPFISTKREELEGALRDFEDAIAEGRGTISDRERLKIIERIERCISESEVTGPTGLQLF